MATPSTLGSHENASDSRSSSGAWRRSRSDQARSSSSLNALSRLIIGTRWRTSWKSPDGAAPTACVGESGVAKVGVAPPRAGAARPASRSYSASGISGASSWWYSSLWCRISARSSAARAAAFGGMAPPSLFVAATAMRRSPHRRRRRDAGRRRAPRSGRAPRAAAGRRSEPPGLNPPGPLHPACAAVSSVQGTGRPCALTCATARSPGASGASTQVSDGPASTTDVRNASAALPTVTRRAATSTCVT